MRDVLIRKALFVVALLGVVAAGAWGLLSPRDGQGDVAVPANVVEVQHGVLRVDGLTDKSLGHVMPGMALPDEVPAGLRRFAVRVTLVATADEALEYGQRDFLVSGPGVKPVVPVRSNFGSGTVPAGSAVSGTLTFDVPKETTTLSLRFQDGRRVRLPRLPKADDEHVRMVTPPSSEGGGHHHGAGQGRGGHS